MAQIHNSKKREIYRPIIEVEYQSIKQLPFILLTIVKTGIRKVNFDLMCGKSKVGVIKYLVIPKYKFIKK